MNILSAEQFIAQGTNAHQIRSMAVFHERVVRNQFTGETIRVPSAVNIKIAKKLREIAEEVENAS